MKQILGVALVFYQACFSSLDYYIQAAFKPFHRESTGQHADEKFIFDGSAMRRLDVEHIA